MILIENQHKVGDNFYGSRQVALDMDKVFAGITTNQEFNQNADQSVLYDNANRALVGRLNYDYAGKYIAEFAFRHEASSLFPKETRWGFFLLYQLVIESLKKNSGKNLHLVLLIISR